MKTLIATVILSFSAVCSVQAATCESIAKGAVDQFVSGAGYKLTSGAAKQAYNDLIENNVAMCKAGVILRENGVSPAQAFTIIQKGAKNNMDARGDVIAVSSTSLSTFVSGMGYAYGE